MNDKEKRPYKVGYKKPPKEHQFRKGEPSPNPRGRRKKSRNFAILLNKGLQEPITITKNGVKKKMTAQEAITLTMIANAIKGNDRAIDRIFKLFPEQRPEERTKQFNTTIERELDALDDEALDKLLELFKSVKST